VSPAGAYVPADICARHQRLKVQMWFICGSDEHGVPITLKKEGVIPRNRRSLPIYKIIVEILLKNGISFDNYSRTSAPIHHDTASEFFY
jgi:methionyl-tRNA synthetase